MKGHLLPVEQRHREAYAFIHAAIFGRSEGDARVGYDCILSGQRDCEFGIQTFVRFERDLPLKDALERTRNTLFMSHHYWLQAAKEALEGDLGKLRRHVAISEGMTRETVLDDMAAALSRTGEASPVPPADLSNKGVG